MSSKNSDNLTTIQADEISANYELNIPVLNALPSTNTQPGDMCYYNGQIYYRDSTQWVLMANASPPTGSLWLVGGNSTTADGVIGTLNNYDVVGQRNGTEYYRLNVSGIDLSKSLNATQNITVGGTLNVNLSDGYLKVNNKNTTSVSMVLTSEISANSNLVINSPNHFRSNSIPTNQHDLVNLEYVSGLSSVFSTITGLNSLSSTSAFKSDISGLTNIYSTITGLNSLSSASAFKSDISGLTNIYSTITGLNSLSSASAFKSDISGLTNIYSTITSVNNLSSNSVLISTISGLTNIYSSITSVNNLSSNSILNGGQAGSLIIGSNNNSLTLQGAGLSRFLVDASGNMAIGANNSPAGLRCQFQNMDNNGGTRKLCIAESSGLNGNQMFLYSTAGVSYLDSYNSATTTASNLVLNTSGGNIGIGKSPSYKLDVNGTVYISGKDVNSVSQYIDSDNNNRRLALYTDGTNNFGAINAYNYSSSSAMPLILNISGGNVGIGNSTPGYKLDVSGVINTKSDIILDGSNFPFIRCKYSNTDQVIYGYNSVLNAGYMGSSTSIPIIIQTNSSEKMRITSAGNVGIGTISPAYKLNVKSDDLIIASFRPVTSASVTSTLIEVGCGADNSNQALYLGMESSQLCIGVRALGQIMKIRDQNSMAIGASYSTSASYNLVTGSINATGYYLSGSLTTPVRACARVNFNSGPLTYTIDTNYKNIGVSSLTRINTGEIYINYSGSAFSAGNYPVVTVSVTAPSASTGAPTCASQDYDAVNHRSYVRMAFGSTFTDYGFHFIAV